MVRHFSRRAVLGGASACAVAATAAGRADQPFLARGVVFESRHGNAQREPGDRGIPGVLVSNGYDVAATASDGSWMLPLAAGERVFVIKPPQWATPLGMGGVPNISRAWPGLNGYARYAVPPEDLLASIDFPLIRQDERSAFEAFLLTDTQPDNDLELGYVRDDIITGVIERNAAFGIHHGDVVGDNLGLYPRYLQLLGATGVPWYHCAGNHDIDREAPTDATSRETWQKFFGPRYFAFQYADATFLILDNVTYAGRTDGSYRGAFGERQLTFVRNVLRHVPRDALVVASMHIPLRCTLDPLNPADTTSDYRELLRVLSGHAHTVSFAGHLHATEHHYLALGEGAAAREHHHHVLTAACGSWWSGPLDHRGIPSADSCDGTPNGFHMLKVDGRSYTTEFVPAVSKRRQPVRVAVQGPDALLAKGDRIPGGRGLSISAEALSGSNLIVNVFDGGPRTQVSCTIAGHREPVVLNRTPMLDPTVVRLFSEHAPRKVWVQPVLSAHVWSMRLPSDLGPGPHRIILRVTDEYGRQQETLHLLEVTPSSPA